MAKAIKLPPSTLFKKYKYKVRKFSIAVYDEDMEQYEELRKEIISLLPILPDKYKERYPTIYNSAVHHEGLYHYTGLTTSTKTLLRLKKKLEKCLHDGTQYTK